MSTHLIVRDHDHRNLFVLVEIHQQLKHNVSVLRVQVTWEMLRAREN